MQNNNYGVTQTGFIKPTYLQLQNDYDEMIRRVFGENAALHNTSYLGLVRDMNVKRISGVWEVLLDIITQMDIDKATGYFLDDIGRRFGLKRKLGTYATGYVTFYRNKPVPVGQSMMITTEQYVSTSTANPVLFYTTGVGNLVPELVEVIELTEQSNTVSVKNVIHSIASVNVSPGTATVTGFVDRTVTFSEVLQPQSLIITYAPLSVTLPVQAARIGSIGNVNRDTINTLVSSLNFVDKVSNEELIITGSDYESDEEFRYRIKNATARTGNATSDAIKFKLLDLPGVLNVKIDDPFYSELEYVYDLTNSDTIRQYDQVIDVVSIVGEVTGQITNYEFDRYTGRITFPNNLSDRITLKYNALMRGQFKVYVAGGVMGDPEEANTILNIIHTTRPAGVQSVGYGDENAHGNPDFPFSYAYRPMESLVELSILTYLDKSVSYREDELTLIRESVKEKVFSYIKSVNMGQSIFRGKIIEKTIEAKPEEILSASVTSWKVDGVEQPAGNEALLIDDEHMIGETVITISFTYV